MVEELLHYFCCFECNSLFAIGCVKGCPKYVSSVVTTGNPRGNKDQKKSRFRAILKISQDDGKGGLSLREVAFMTVLTVLAVLENTLPSFCWSYKNTGQRGNRDGFDGSGGFGGCGGFGRDGYPPFP